MTPTEIAIRAYTEKANFKPRQPGKRGLDSPSAWTLIFDVETTIDPAQSLRVGAFQLRKAGELKREGLFCDPDILSDSDLNTVKRYANARGIGLLTVDAFRRRFLDNAYWKGALVVGFNLPFDISRIAVGHSEARGPMRGGFTFRLSPYNNQPALRVKHLSRRASLIDFAAPGKQRTPRGMRKRGCQVPHHRGYFVDVKTLAAALTSRSFSLESLCGFLKVPTLKQASEDHGGPITNAYLDYARADVQATWECFEALHRQYQEHGLAKPVHRILSEASLGKAYLEAMGIDPLLACQPDMDRAIFGPIMATYYGGRAEVRIRREVTRVHYVDFKSMYPTVNALMGLWRFVIADGFTMRDATEETRAFLDRITAGDFQDKAVWPQLTMLVRLKPQGDVLPTRAKYDGKVNTIGLNHLTSEEPLWYTLADVVASKFLTGRTPDIIGAIAFEPGPVQSGLKPIDLFGKADFRVDPQTDDVFNRLVDLRDNAKANGDPVQQAIKIITNSTSYGIFIEVQRDDAPKPKPLIVYGPDGQRHETRSTALEQPGNYFHPLLGTLITGAARLMLALAECRAEAEGLGWVFCDTDSLAIAKPSSLSEVEFQVRVQAVIDWFTPLNPYRKPGSILQTEDVNFDPETRQPTPLYAFAISAKRYVLFNLDSEGRPVIRKASAHGLGHLIDPYGEDHPAPGIPAPIARLSEIGVKHWQYDLWFVIVTAALSGQPDRVCLDYHPELALTALQRYGATSPRLLKWLEHWNEGKPYTEQVKPFGLMTAFMASRGTWCDIPMDEFAEPSQRGRPPKMADPKPIAPFERDPARAVHVAFDRETGNPVLPEQLKTYAEALAQYHLSSESKFENGAFTNTGKTRRRHVVANGVRLIGKEGNGVGEFGEVEPGAGSLTGLGALKKRSSHLSIIESAKDAEHYRSQSAAGDSLPSEMVSHFISRAHSANAGLRQALYIAGEVGPYFKLTVCAVAGDGCLGREIAAVRILTPSL